MFRNYIIFVYLKVIRNQMNKRSVFDRKHIISKLDDKIHWDVIVIGGGATGLGCALDSISRGYIKHYSWSK